jgi:hypothetical protein
MTRALDLSGVIRMVPEYFGERIFWRKNERHLRQFKRKYVGLLETVQCLGWEHFLQQILMLLFSIVTHVATPLSICSIHTSSVGVSYAVQNASLLS